MSSRRSGRSEVRRAGEKCTGVGDYSIRVGVVLYNFWSLHIEGGGQLGLDLSSWCPLLA